MREIHAATESARLLHLLSPTLPSSVPMKIIQKLFLVAFGILSILVGLALSIAQIAPLSQHTIGSAGYRSLLVLLPQTLFMIFIVSPFFYVGCKWIRQAMRPNDGK